MLPDPYTDCGFVVLRGLESISFSFFNAEESNFCVGGN